MRHIVSCILAAGIIAAFALPIAAGDVDPPFAARLATAAPTDVFQAIVCLDDQVDVAALDGRLEAMRATRRFRHEVVVSRLIERAKVTQASLVPVLDRLQREGSLESYESLWVMNAFLVRSNAAAVSLLARTDGIGVIYDGGLRVEVVSPVDEQPSGPNAATSAPEPGIAAIRATDLWNLGYRGKGRIVCCVDTGVDGNHPALRNSWRGTEPGVSAAEAWFDPAGTTTFPQDSGGHGTHVCGTMVGLDGANQIGVAPDAKWIAAQWRWPPTSLFISDVIRAYQWAADPDGDPKTVTDVPDVICNSWGLIPVTHGVNKCDPSFWNVIDNVEYSGATVIFIAGNEGSRGPASLRTPGDRVGSAVNVFSVGAIDANSVIASFSSRGPSGCDNQTIKPEVCAPGVLVRSSYPVAGYRQLSGTSMACPHVSGGVALLREVWPNVTAQRIKQILLTTCDDLGPAGEDNAYGMGRINLLSAYNQLLSERPNVSVSAMGTVRRYREGQKFQGHLVVINNTNQPQAVRLTVRFEFDGVPTNLVPVPPVDLVVPAGYSNDALPLNVAFPIPTGLPASVLDPKLWSMVAESSTHGGGPVLHTSRYDFSLTR